MIILSISICFRCQKGGEPANRVYMMTPVLHLNRARAACQPPTPQWAGPVQDAWCSRAGVGGVVQEGRGCRASAGDLVQQAGVGGLAQQGQCSTGGAGGLVQRVWRSRGGAGGLAQQGWAAGLVQEGWLPLSAALNWEGEGESLPR